MKLGTRALTASALAAAAVFVLTWTVAIPVSATGGYINPGDAVIYLASLILGPPAAAAAAVGSALADLAGGYTIFVPATFVIKGLMGYICARLSRKGSFPLYALGCVVSGAVMVAGYFAYETALFGLKGTLAEIVPNIVQWVICAAAAIALYPAATALKRVIGRAAPGGS